MYDVVVVHGKIATETHEGVNFDTSTPIDVHMAVTLHKRFQSHTVFTGFRYPVSRRSDEMTVNNLWGKIVLVKRYKTKDYGLELYNWIYN